MKVWIDHQNPLVQTPAVEKVDDAIHRINLYPAYRAIGFSNTTGSLSRFWTTGARLLVAVFWLLRHRLYWLPIKFRIKFKIAMFCFKRIHGHAPNYLKSMVAMRKTLTYNLRSNTSIQLEDHSRQSKKPLVIGLFPMHPPRFGTISRNHYSHSKILTPLSHCLA